MHKKLSTMKKIISWNIDSINAALTSDSARAVLSRNVLDIIKAEAADIIAIQETKLPATGLNEKQKAILMEYFPDYKIEFVSSQPPAKKGYAGTMVLYRNVYTASGSATKINAPDTMDSEGRLLTLDFGDFYLVNVYTPNAGDGLKRLAERQQWDICYADYLSKLDKEKPVIACGDFNVAHQEIDLANPDSNHFSAGFTDEERAGFSNLLGRGFVDTFRYLNGNVEKVYSWWSQRITTAKMNNAGWRIDYFLVSDRIKGSIRKSVMLDSGSRADHTPLMLEISDF